MDVLGGIAKVPKALAWPFLFSIAGYRQGVHRGIHREAHLGGIALQGLSYEVYYVSQQFRGTPMAKAFVCAEVRVST